jgi:hypothetical protein
MCLIPWMQKLGFRRSEAFIVRLGVIAIAAL